MNLEYIIEVSYTLGERGSLRSFLFPLLFFAILSVILAVSWIWEKIPDNADATFESN